MRIFIDTSAFYAGLCKTDQCHQDAMSIWTLLLNESFSLITSNYIEIETMALVQNRLGMAAVRTFLHDLLPVVDSRFVSEGDHRSSTAALVAAGQRKLSFVDLSSFQLMRRLGIGHCFSFDKHFREQGFRLVNLKILDELRNP